MNKSNKKSDFVPLMNNNDDEVIEYDSDEDFDEKPVEKHDITLWLSDAVVLIFEHLQYYAVLLSLSEHWGWPSGWVKATSFTFIFNADIWEFRKVETGLFDHSRVSFIDSDKLGFNYLSYLIAWVVVIIIIAAVFSGVYMRWMKRRPLYLLLYISRWKRIMFIVVNFFSVPFGIASGRIFHCRKNDKGIEVLDVQNEFLCYDDEHISLMVVVLIICSFLYFIYPFILSRWVNEQIFSNDPLRHEGYIQLKESEYEQGLDISWEIGQYYLFSSFRRPWAFYNPLKFAFKFLLIVGFAFSVKSPFWSSAGITILFSIATVSLIFVRPFRVKCFNFMIICSHLILALNALVGNFMVRPPWVNPEKFQIVAFLRYPTILNILLAFNVTWVVLLLLWMFYLFLLNNGIWKKERIWPKLYDSTNTIGDDTKRYLKAALKARCILEGALSAIPLFAPIHDLSHQVQVINAYCREAEYIRDPTHDTLCDLLDELIEAHNALVPLSIFGMSVKNSIRETSEEFIKLMPSFRKRLKQREYDFILVPPVKRRLLLKMYILSVFINSRKKTGRPDNDVKVKLQEALAMFDSRSIDDYDPGFYSSMPSSSSGRPITGASLLLNDDSGRESNITKFLNDVDGLFRANSEFANQNVLNGSQSSSSSSNVSIGRRHLSSRGKQKKGSIPDSVLMKDVTREDFQPAKEDAAFQNDHSPDGPDNSPLFSTTQQPEMNSESDSLPSTSGKNNITFSPDPSIGPRNFGLVDV